MATVTEVRSESSQAYDWSYDEAFARNVGLVTRTEQQILRNSHVAIAGMGGVGGVHLATLARLGIGNFTIADPDVFEISNTNRQYGAKVHNYGRSKATVMAEEVRAIFPDVQIAVYPEKVTESNVAEFLQDADVFLDGVDFFAIEARRMLFRVSRELGIWALTAGPIGFSSAWMCFDPDGMSFDDYFAIDDETEFVDKLLAFVVGLTPGATQRQYINLREVKCDRESAPSVSLACQLASGVAASEIVKILLNRGKLRPAPWSFQFDPHVHKLVQNRYSNNHILRRLSLRIFKKLCTKLGVLDGLVE